MLHFLPLKFYSIWKRAWRQIEIKIELVLLKILIGEADLIHSETVKSLQCICTSSSGQSYKVILKKQEIPVAGRQTRVVCVWAQLLMRDCMVLGRLLCFLHVHSSDELLKREREYILVYFPVPVIKFPDKWDIEKEGLFCFTIQSYSPTIPGKS